MSCSQQLTDQSRQLSHQLKQNKNGDDIFTQRNLEMVTSFLRQQEHVSASEKATMKIPDFPANHTWFNSEPVSFQKHLKGKLVVIDFWTYCCINCLHVLPDMEYLEQKFKDESSIVFLGCHSAKFLNEKGSSKVRDAVLRYEIKHPVINDDKMIVWRQTERRSWPSQIVVSPKSQMPILILHGEG